MRRLAPLLLLALSACSLIDDSVPTCTTIPHQADETITRITTGGPYPYPDNDDHRFGNYEGHLPAAARDYYREYTVDTPGVSHRGARRIVTGSAGAGIDVWYYTDDHYESFCRIPDAHIEEVSNA